MKSTKPVASPKSYPVGLFLHTLRPNGIINNQGQILAIDGDTFLVQLFSFLTGEATIIKAISRAMVYSNLCILYPDRQRMLDGYENNCKRFPSA